LATESVIAIDPDTRLSGWARFDRGALVSAGIARSKAATLAARAREQAAFIAAQCTPNHQPVIEYVQYYPGRNRTNPNDLIGLAFAAGAHVGFYKLTPVIPYAHTWKGSVPKELHNDRTRALLARLGASRVIDSVPKSHQNHALDAIALGFWFLGS